MAIPRVFISSTCYDLKHIRESLKYFVRTIGYEPVLSNEGDVFYSPDIHTHESCLKEVETCQIFILIIGGRYGGKFINNNTSITNNEYKAAIKKNIPIFALVEQSVYSEHFLFSENKNNDIAHLIDYPSVNNIKIFEFIDEVCQQIRNNAIYSFKDFSDIESYLKKQWAGMMYDFIMNRSNDDKNKLTNRLLEDLTLATKKTEDLLKLIARQNADKPGSEIEKQIDKIERISGLTKAIRAIFDTSWIHSIIPTTPIDALIEKILSSNDMLSFINGHENTTAYLDEKNGLIVVKLYDKDGESCHSMHQIVKSHFDESKDAFDHLKRANKEELALAFNELIK